MIARTRFKCRHRNRHGRRRCRRHQHSHWPASSFHTLFSHLNISLIRRTHTPFVRQRVGALIGINSTHYYLLYFVVLFFFLLIIVRAHKQALERPSATHPDDFAPFHLFPCNFHYFEIHIDPSWAHSFIAYTISNKSLSVHLQSRTNIISSTKLTHGHASNDAATAHQPFDRCCVFACVRSLNHLHPHPHTHTYLTHSPSGNFATFAEAI